MAYHATPKIFGYVHARASHGKTKTIQKQWEPAERRLLDRFAPRRMFKMIILGIKSERI